MHALFSTLISYFLSPFNWILVLIAIAIFFTRRPKIRRWYLLSALLIFLVFGNQALIDFYANRWQPAPMVMTPGKTYSCGIVAGGFASPDGKAKGFFNATADRFIQALKLYKQGYISHILVSGGNGKPGSKTFREGAFVKQELIAMGVPDSVIMVEDRSNNTADNAANANEILKANKLSPPYLLISSAHHLPRAMLLFEKAGVVTEPFPCNYFAGRNKLDFSSFIPSLGGLFTWETYLKETFGYVYYKHFKK
ncbi:MAG: YdcF family protein [Bacteroidota bacterium]